MVRYRSDRFANIENTIVYNNYSLVNAVLTYTSKIFGLSLYGKNPGDSFYAPFSESFYPGQAILGAPHALEASIQFAF